MYNATKTMKNKVNSAEILGMSDDEISKTFIDRNRRKDFSIHKSRTV